MVEGYCTAEDVRVALQEAELSGALGTEMVEAAIDAQTDWLRRQTGRHWYTTEANPDPILPTDTRSITNDNYDIPSSPHAQPLQLPTADYRRYPQTEGGGYARVRLQFRDVQKVTKLQVRSGRDYEDWVANSSKTDGSGEDYYLRGDPKLGGTDLYLDTHGMTPQQDWTNAVIVDYEYGHEGIPGSIRRAQAALAGADLVMDDDVKTAIPNDGQLIPIETKADRLIKQANRLLENYR